MAKTGPSTASGGRTTATRVPSGSRASTIGLLRSARSPSGPTSRSMLLAIRSLSAMTPERSRRPFRSIHTSPGPLTKTSVTAGSSMSIWMGPRPTSSTARACARLWTSTVAKRGASSAKSSASRFAALTEPVSAAKRRRTLASSASVSPSNLMQLPSVNAQVPGDFCVSAIRRLPSEQ